MAFETDIWVHGLAFGTGFPADFPEVASLVASSLRRVERSPSGIRFNANLPSTHVFHVPIPSPTILNDFRMRLSRVFVFYQTVGEVRISSVAVYDGRRLIRVFDNLGWSGSHGDSIDVSNQLTLSPTENIANGIALVMVVEFGAAPPASFNSVIFSAAGIRLFSGERLVSIIQWFNSLIERSRPFPS